MPSTAWRLCTAGCPCAPAAHLEAYNDDPDHPEDVGGEEAVEHVELVLHLARVDHVEQLRHKWEWLGRGVGGGSSAECAAGSACRNSSGVLQHSCWPHAPQHRQQLPTWQKMKVLNTMEEMSFLAVSSLSCQSLYSCMAQGVEGQAR